ncbi:PREDICTED: uncharacterized protein LOC107344993 [Paramuricea clavata]|uniref:PREDICTED: uncharacterized protein LOC107344993 n=1 Tax=Paramuricea clavata TaxID=317549 RepID=A0A6S7K9Z0_PARCT|nr:PREDICTED: uncharacterized protein LOC107344993 [Paramuricea clavata]
MVAQHHHHAKASVGNETTVILERKRAQLLIVRNLHIEAFEEEFDSLEKKTDCQKTSPLLKLYYPIIDSDGLLRIGGRLKRADLPYEERHPLILHGKHHVTSLIVKNCHEEAKHQDRHFTHGMVRSKGFWIVGGKRLVNRVIHPCLKFTARRTRRGHAYSKRWAVIFTCLSTRAIHIELIESMDASSFINALRRFMAIRGPVQQIRSDCGTNFKGAQNELESALKETDQKIVETYLNSPECEWIFNSPHASHRGGV